MCRQLSAGVLVPLTIVSLLPIAYYIFTRYVVFEQRMVCSISQATNISYSSMSNLSVLLFLAGALTIAITRMLYATVLCLHTTYTVWQERNSRETNDLVR